MADTMHVSGDISQWKKVFVAFVFVCIVSGLYQFHGQLRSRENVNTVPSETSYLQSQSFLETSPNGYENLPNLTSEKNDWILFQKLVEGSLVPNYENRKIPFTDGIQQRTTFVMERYILPKVTTVLPKASNSPRRISATAVPPHVNAYFRMMTTAPPSLKVHGKEQEAVKLCTMEERKHYLDRMCSLYGQEMPAPHYSTLFLVSDELQIAYCFIPKCASSMFKTVLLKTNSAGRNKSRIFIHTTDTTDLKERGLRYVKYHSNEMAGIANYTKILITRNPFDRVVSAFNDKFILSEFADYPQRLRKISGLTDEDPLQFWMFAQALTSHRKWFINDHWSDVGRGCEPCELNYDYILRVETMPRDLSLVESRMKQPWNRRGIGPYHTHRYNTLRSGEEAARRGVVHPRRLPEFGNVPEDDALKLYEQYKYDFQLYGYQFDILTQEASCKIINEKGDACC